MNPGKNVTHARESSSSHKRSRESSSSHKRSRESTILSREMESDIQKALFEMVDKRLLTLADLPFAQSYFSQSSWAANYFLASHDIAERCSLINDARNKEEDKKVNKKRRNGV